MPREEADPTIQKALETLIALVNQLRTLLSPPPPPASTPAAQKNSSTNTCTTLKAGGNENEDGNTLVQLQNAGKVLKLHTTRLSVSLLPKAGGGDSDTPAIAAVTVACIKSIISVLPTIAAHTQTILLHPEKHGRSLAGATRSAVIDLLNALVEYALGAPATREGMVNTGKVWAAADRIIALSPSAVVATSVLAAEELVCDAAKELKVWIDNERNANDDDDDDDGNRNGDWCSEDIDEGFAQPNKSSTSTSTILSSAETTAKKIRLIIILLGAARKRRLCIYSQPQPDYIQKLDAVAAAANDISELVDNLCVAYYEDEEIIDINKSFQAMLNKAISLAEILIFNEKGERDKFSGWFEKGIATLSSLSV
jgi:hypothetical protein